MAKENYVSLVGQVIRDPVIERDEKGKPVRAFFALTTLRRDLRDYAGNMSPKWDKPVIMSSAPDMLAKIEGIKLYDIVEVKGILATKDYTRGTRCPTCGRVNYADATMTYVSPAFINVRQHMESRTQGMGVMKDLAEISNTLKIFGTVCREPEYTEARDRTEKSRCKFNIAANRKLFVFGDDPRMNTDYPWVYVYGDMADETRFALSVGSDIYIDGYVHTRKFKDRAVCENEDCETKEYEFENQAIIVSPYSIEYLEGCNKPESTHTDHEQNDSFEIDNFGEAG